MKKVFSESPRLTFDGCDWTDEQTGRAWTCPDLADYWDVVDMADVVVFHMYKEDPGEECYFVWHDEDKHYDAFVVEACNPSEGEQNTLNTNMAMCEWLWDGIGRDRNDEENNGREYGVYIVLTDES